MDEPKLRPWEDPKTARLLARVHWIVLVASFVLLTRFPLEPEIRPYGALAVVVVSLALNFPVMLGLYKSQDQGGTKAYRAVAFMLLLRLAATAWVAQMLA